MNAASSKNPLKAIFAVRRDELPLAILMFGQFFLIVSTFWVLKPIKKTLFFEHYSERTLDILGLNLGGAQAELLAKTLNLGVAYVAVVVFSLVSRRFRREKLMHCFLGFFMLSFFGYSFLLDSASSWVAWTFYLFGDLYSTLMVATFFAFLNDSTEPQDAKRIYGPIVLGGVLGGAVGTTAVASFISVLERSSWMWVAGASSLLIAMFAKWAASRVERLKPVQKDCATEALERSESTNAAWRGARLVLSSRYLLSIVAIVGLYELISTVMDFQFSATVQHYASLGHVDAGQYFANTYAITNGAALFIQLFVTSAVMSRFPLTVALLMLPVVALSASSVFLVMPVLLLASGLNTADNALSYSINQSAREALYTVTSEEEKYKAKAFIDMFVQRFAKVIAVGISLGATVWFSDFSTVRYLTFFTLFAGVFWVLAARYAGKQFQSRSAR